MPSYMIRHVPEGLIPAAKARARAEDQTLDAVLIRYLETYAKHGHPPAAGARAVNAARTTDERSAAARHAVSERWRKEKGEATK